MGESGQRGRLFGTDGVRGVAGYELTAALALDLSVAAAAILGTDGADAGTTGAGTTGAGTTGPGRHPVAWPLRSLGRQSDNSHRPGG